MNQLESWWVSNRVMTFGVTVENGIIIETAPIARKFIGQPFDNLERWMMRLSHYRKEKLLDRGTPEDSE